jgi:beta-1,4-mannosyl-glycoprotein beta-1,4-N-acetylglucosaminyltransferase
MVIDVITYNGEKDLFDLRFNILKDYVDEFIVVEAPTTFSGKPKPLYFNEIKHLYPQVRYYVIDENYSQEELDLAQNSPNTVGASHWKHEFLQKESIKKALAHLNDNDIVFIGDVDEIWNPQMPNYKKDQVWKLKLIVYTYYLNNRSTEQFWGTIRGYYKDIKNECLNHLRTQAEKTTEYCGWHFTSQGGVAELSRKLDDSYTAESYNTNEVQQRLAERYGHTDFLGRDFVFRKDESDLPKYLKENKNKYKHLCLTEK